MSWSYTGDPASSNLDAGRFNLGDTDSTWQQLTDEEVLFVISKQSSFVDQATALPDKEIFAAAATGADALCGFYARYINTKNKSLGIDAAERFEHYKKLAKLLWSKAGINLDEQGRRAVVAGAFAGGLTLSGKRTLEENTDDVQPAFKRGADDHPGTAQDPVLSDRLLGQS